MRNLMVFGMFRLLWRVGRHRWRGTRGGYGTCGGGGVVIPPWLPHHVSGPANPVLTPGPDESAVLAAVKSTIAADSAQILTTPEAPDLGAGTEIFPVWDLGYEVLIFPEGDQGPEMLITPVGDQGPEVLKTPVAPQGRTINASDSGDSPVEEEGSAGDEQLPLFDEGPYRAVAGEGMLARLPIYTRGGKTSGILVSGGDETSLSSGYGGPTASIPRGTPGFNLITRGHVEGQAAAIMRQQGLQEATLYINNPSGPCPGAQGCDYLLPRMLPEGSQLRVVAPGGFNQTYFGLQDDVFVRS